MERDNGSTTSSCVCILNDGRNLIDQSDSVLIALEGKISQRVVLHGTSSMLVGANDIGCAGKKDQGQICRGSSLETADVEEDAGAESNANDRFCVLFLL